MVLRVAHRSDTSVGQLMREPISSKSLFGMRYCASRVRSSDILAAPLTWDDSYTVHCTNTIQVRYATTVDDADYATPTPQHELDRTDHTDHTDHTDNTDQECICVPRNI